MDNFLPLEQTISEIVDRLWITSEDWPQNQTETSEFLQYIKVVKKGQRGLRVPRELNYLTCIFSLGVVRAHGRWGKRTKRGEAARPPNWPKARKAPKRKRDGHYRKTKPPPHDLKEEFAEGAEGKKTPGRHEHIEGRGTKERANSLQDNSEPRRKRNEARDGMEHAGKSPPPEGTKQPQPRASQQGEQKETRNKAVTGGAGEVPQYF